MRKTNSHWFLKTSISMMKTALFSRGYPMNMIIEMTDEDVRALYESGFMFRMAA